RARARPRAPSRHAARRVARPAGEQGPDAGRAGRVPARPRPHRAPQAERRHAPGGGRLKDGPAAIAVACALVVAVVAAYFPVLGFDFVSFDDPLSVTANPQVQAGLHAEGVRWAF